MGAGILLGGKGWWWAFHSPGGGKDTTGREGVVVGLPHSQLVVGGSHTTGREGAVVGLPQSQLVVGARDTTGREWMRGVLWVASLKGLPGWGANTLMACNESKPSPRKCTQMCQFLIAETAVA